MEKGFLLKHGGQFSINNLVGFKEDGRFVMRTGHLGNHYLSNLLLFHCGIPCYLFDRNRLMKDKNFWPSKIIVDGKRLSLAEEEEIFVPFSKFVKNMDGAGAFVGSSRNPAHVHMESMKKLFGDLVFTESQFFEENLQTVGKLSRLMNEVAPELFLRKVYANGASFKVERSVPDASMGFLKANRAMHDILNGIEGEFDEGIVPEVQTTIIINGILGHQSSDHHEIYELSGPDMVKYSLGSSFRENINRIYESMRKKMPELPESIVSHIIPTFSFRFGSLANEREVMDEWWKNLKKIGGLKAEKREMKEKLKIVISSNDKKLVNEKIREALAPINERLESSVGSILASPLTKRIAFTLEKGDFFSQYDLLVSGEKLYVPEEIRSIPLNEVEKYHLLLDEIIRGGKK